MKKNMVRAIELLRHLPRAPRRTDAGSLVRKLRSLGFHTTLRMVQRDLAGLSAHFPIDCRETEKPYGWAWAAGALPPVVPTMDSATALVFRLVELHLASVLPASVRGLLAPQFEAAAQVLGMADPDGGLAARVRILPAGLAARPPAVADEVLGAVTEALAQRRMLLVEYAARGRATHRSLRLSPRALVLRGPSMTLIAHAAEPDGTSTTRSYVLHRMATAQVLSDRPVAPAPGFQLDAFIADGGLAPRYATSPIDLRLRVHAEAAAAVREGKLGDDRRIEELEGGAVRLRVRIADNHHLRAWILGFGALAFVEGPPELRTWFAETSRRMSGGYEGGLETSFGT